MTDRTSQQPRFIGARITRLEDPRLISGQARYIDDLVLPGMLHLRLVRSELAHAKLANIDVSALHEGFPDALVFTGQDIGMLGIRRACRPACSRFWRVSAFASLASRSPPC
jgi:carbon-monoxide dehydrogenase large subunit